MALKPLTHSRRYEQFIKQRDHALEDILFKYQVAINTVVSVLETRSKEIAAHLIISNPTPEHARKLRDEFHKRIEPYFNAAIHQTVFLMKSLRRTTYILSYAGQAEAIGRALGAQTNANLTQSDLHKVVNNETPSGGNPFPRIELAFHRLLRDVVDSFQLSQVLGSTPAETLGRIDRAFPPSKKIKKKMPMAKMKEARHEREPEMNFSFGVIEPQEWEQAVKDYTEEYLPVGRGPYDQVFYPVSLDRNEIDEDEIEGYQWELEQEMTNDFVQNVRDGENDAANENGIDDFQFIAITDSKTDECCLSRDGYTTREIQDKIDAGEEMGDCDEVEPPIHMNCRCRLAPMTDDIPEKEPPDFGSFNDWLDQKASEL